MILRVSLVSWAPGPRGDWVRWDLGTSHEGHGAAQPHKERLWHSRYFTCFGVQVTKVGKVASQAGKKIVDYTNVTRGMMVDYAVKSTSMMHGGDPSTLRLWGDTLREFTPCNLLCW